MINMSKRNKRQKIQYYKEKLKSFSVIINLVVSDLIFHYSFSISITISSLGSFYYSGYCYCYSYF